jgi:hypothetical protein
MRVPATLQRAFATLVAVIPLFGGTDPCTVGALTGHVSLSCVSQAEAAMSCHVQTAPQPACSHCGPAAPETTDPRPQGGTCCDLKPQAPGAAEQPTLTAPAPAQHPALVVGTALIAPAPAWHGLSVSAADESPPGEPPLPLSPRAPPLA